MLFDILSDTHFVDRWQSECCSLWNRNRWYLRRFVQYIQSNLPMQLPLLSSHLYLKVTHFLARH